MGIYIPNMDMPKNCSSCPFCFGANNICPWVREYATCKGRHKDCPLVDVTQSVYREFAKRLEKCLIEEVLP